MSLRITKKLLTFGIGLCVFPALAINCKKAETAVEKAICSDKSLQKLDDSLNEAYEIRTYSLKKDQAESIRSAQKKWLKERDEKCKKDIACLSKEMNERISELRKFELGSFTKKDQTVKSTTLAEYEWPEFVLSDAKIQDQINKNLKEVAVIDSCGESDNAEYDEGRSLSSILTLIGLSSPWALLEYQESDSCGAGTNSSEDQYILNLKSGAFSSLEEMLDSKKKKDLAKVFLKSAASDTEGCESALSAETINADTSWSMNISGRKFTLSPVQPHVDSAVCGASLEMSPEEIAKYLKKDALLLQTPWLK